jgi:hypothetical protein
MSKRSIEIAQNLILLCTTLGFHIASVILKRPLSKQEVQRLTA